MSFDYKKNRPWAENLTIVMQIGLTMAGCIAFVFLSVSSSISGWAPRGFSSPYLSYWALSVVLTSFTGKSWRSSVTRRKTNKDGNMESIRSTQKKYGSRALADCRHRWFRHLLDRPKRAGKRPCFGNSFQCGSTSSSWVKRCLSNSVDRVNQPFPSP